MSDGGGGDGGNSYSGFDIDGDSWSASDEDSRHPPHPLLQALYDVSKSMAWWKGICLAVFLYVAMHQLWLASFDWIIEGTSGLIKLVVRFVAEVLQYLLPFTVLGGAAAAWYADRVRAFKTHNPKARRTAELASMTELQFELLTAEIFRFHGYSSFHPGVRAAEASIDVELRKGDQVALVQREYWQDEQVFEEAVLELHAAMLERKADHGYMITCGSYSTNAKILAKGRNIHLIDGAGLNSWIKRLKAKGVDVMAAAAAEQGVAPQLRRMG